MDSKGGYPHPQPPPSYGFDQTHGPYVPAQAPPTVIIEQPQGNHQLIGQFNDLQLVRIN